VNAIGGLIHFHLRHQVISLGGDRVTTRDSICKATRKMAQM
jgi:hypothetical protein